MFFVFDFFATLFGALFMAASWGLASYRIENRLHCSRMALLRDLLPLGALIHYLWEYANSLPSNKAEGDK